jgi:Mn-dependent DtxR family transcriptional regulator
MTGAHQLSAFERRLLATLAQADGELPSAGLALTLDTDLEQVLETVPALQERNLLVREGFDSCRLTEAGRAVLATPTD